MEQYYYNHMNKAQQAAYHSILSGVKNLADEFQIPALEGEELYNVFFQMRLDHPEIFWVSSYKYRYYKDSPNLIFIPEYLFDKKKICEHQKARLRSCLSGRKRSMCMILSVKISAMIN